MLDRWWPHVVAMSLVSPSTVISGADGVSLSAQIVSFDMPVAPTSAPLGTIGRFSGTWEHKKGDSGIQAWISVDFGSISGPHFGSVWRTLEQHASCLSCLFPGHVLG